MNRSNVDAAIRIRLYIVVAIFVVSSSIGSVQAAVEKHPIPSAARQAEIKKLLEETYSLKKADNATKKEQAAATLIEAVEGGELSSDETYVVLTNVLALTKDAGKFEAFIDAVDRIGKIFEGDPIQVKQKQVVDFMQDCKNGESLKAAIAEAISTARVDAAENRFPEAMALLAAADSANRRTTGGAAIKQTITEARKSVAARETQWKAYQKAKATLVKTPDDPEASWTVGRWSAVVDKNWATALPLLAKGSNAQWKALSAMEMKASSENAAQIAVADGWWDIAQNENTDAKLALLQHAGDWYSRALSGTTALQKLRIEKRLGEIGEVPATISGTSTALKPAVAYEQPVEITPAGAKGIFGGGATTRSADWNADGIPDVIVGGDNGYVWLMTNSGNGQLSPPKKVAAGGSDMRVGEMWVTACLADLNGDSKPDLVVAHSEDQVALFENKGTAKAPRFDFPKPLISTLGTALKFTPRTKGRMDVGDWDGDGDMDIVAGHYEGPIMCYRNIGNARAPKFAEGQPLQINGSPSSFSYNVLPLLFDVNQDGIVDVVYGVNWGTMGFLIAGKHVSATKSTEPGSPLIQSTGSPVYVSGKEIVLREIGGDNATPAIADFDGDGVLDIISGGAKGRIWLLRGVVQTSVPK